MRIAIMFLFMVSMALTRSITSAVSSNALSPPFLIKPVNNSILNDVTPHFTWEQNTDENFVTYSFEISTSDAFTNPKINNVSRTEYTPTFNNSLKDMTTYYWRVRAKDLLNNFSPYSPTWRFFIDLEEVTILDRETYDADGDGWGDAIKLILNIDVLDSSVYPSDFMIDMGNQLLEKSILINIPGDIPNDRVICLGTPNKYSSDKEPVVRYVGTGFKSVSGKPLSPKSYTMSAADNLGPVLTRVQAALWRDSNVTIVKVNLSEGIEKGPLENKWIVESPLGTSLQVSSLEYDSAQKTLRLKIPSLLKPRDPLRVEGKNLYDSKNNFTRSWEKSSTEILNDFRTEIKYGNSASQQSGRGVSPDAPIVFIFDREIDRASLESKVSVTEFMDRDGRSTNRKISGKINIFPALTEANFVPDNALPKGSKFRVTISSNLLDSFGLTVPMESAWEFETIRDRIFEATLNPAENLQVVVKPGAFPRDASVEVKTSARTQAKFTDISKIDKAAHLAKSRGEKMGKPDHYVIDDMVIEIVAIGENGRPIQGALDADVILTMTYTDVNNDGWVDGTHPKVNAQDLSFYYLNEINNEFEKVQGTVIDSARKTVTVSVRHFSIYAVMSGLSSNINNVILRPSPWDRSADPAPLIIDNLTDPASIDIYSITGQIIRTITMTDGKGRSEWDGKNDAGETVGSGVYILRVSGGGSSKNLKLLVIR